MEISGKLPPVSPKQSVTAGRAAKKSQETKPVSAAGADRVTFSRQARQLQVARQAVSGMPDVDMDKVAKIRAQLKDGTYKVDAHKIAANMLQEMLHGQQG